MARCRKDLTQYASDRSLDTCTLIPALVSQVRCTSMYDLWRTGVEGINSPLSPVLHISYVCLACETLPACTIGLLCTYKREHCLQSCVACESLNYSKVDFTLSMIVYTQKLSGLFLLRQPERYKLKNCAFGAVNDLVLAQDVT